MYNIMYNLYNSILYNGVIQKEGIQESLLKTYTLIS